MASRRRVLQQAVTVTAAATSAGLLASAFTAPAPAVAKPPPAWPTDFHAWTGLLTFTTSGQRERVIPAASGLTLRPGASTGSWTSPWYAPRGGFTEAIVSWQITTPPGSWARIEFQVRGANATSKWLVMGDWAADTSTIKRHSTNGQTDPLGRISTDTFFAAAGAKPAAYRTRVTLHGRFGARPTLKQVAAASSVPGKAPESPSAPLSRRAVELRVPALSQSVHSGEYPAYGGGGGVWCSPTSTTMVLGFWGTGPGPRDVAALPPDPKFDANKRVDGEVDCTVFGVWDEVYEGAGNWPFNTAFASTYGLDASVRQYSTLAEWEYWVRRGVPVVTTLHWDNASPDPRDHLDGSSITQTDGHLVVLVGITAAGDAIVNDPASPSNDKVRHIYRRGQFEYRWLDSTNGTGYLIKRPSIKG